MTHSDTDFIQVKKVIEKIINNIINHPNDDKFRYILIFVPIYACHNSSNINIMIESILHAI